MGYFCDVCVPADISGSTAGSDTSAPAAHSDDHYPSFFVPALFKGMSQLYFGVV